MSLIIGNISSVLYGGIRPFAGIFYDKIGFKICVNVVILIQLIIEFVFIKSANYKFTYGLVIVSVYAC